MAQAFAEKTLSKRGAVGLPASLEADLAVERRLEEQARRDPRLSAALVALRERLVGQIPRDAPALCATTLVNVGITYTQLLTGDRDANLQRAIASYRDAIRVFTPPCRASRLRRGPARPGQSLRPGTDRGPGGQLGTRHRLL